MRVKRIHAINFKGFPTLDIEFTGSSVILGGMNGFGKTTIFDALELLFTGKINRMEQYSETLPNHKYSRSQSQLPLVCDMKHDFVEISVTLEFAEDEIILQRRASVNQMKNPIDFSPFSTLYIFDATKSKYRPISSEESARFDLTRWSKDYNFLNYLSQEESTSFLKCKDSVRTNLIQSLFDTDIFDIPISKINEVLSILDRLLKSLSSNYTQISNEICGLKNVEKQGGSTEYIRLCNIDSAWDSEEPDLSYEDFNAMVSDNGVIDGLLYYIKHEDSFKRNNRNKKILGYLNSGSIEKYIYSKYCLKRKVYIDDFIYFQKNLISPINNLNSVNIECIKLYELNLLDSIVTNGVVRTAQTLINNYVSAVHSASTMQKLVQEIIFTRDSLAEKINNNNLEISSCPLCGANFESFNTLTSNIKNYGNAFKASFSQVNNGLTEQFLCVKEYLRLNICEPIIKYYNEKGVSDWMVEMCSSVNEKDIKEIDSVLTYLNISYSIDGNLDNCISDLRSKLEKLVVPVDENIDMNLLQRIYVSYIKTINRDVFTIDNIEKKRSFLISKWNKKQTALFNQKNKMMKMVERKIRILNKKKDDLKKLLGQIKQHKTNYINKVISDIQILFYVYSGRILQDNYFGRGLFLKPEISKNRILFIAGNYKENDVDVLYNMSSGQLVAVAVSFLLSLNRLYSKSKYIAIDDPVQTIDDINLWGLMETLRHDFKDRFILLSTHERNYGQLLDYKFRKIGINSEYIDMGDKHVL